VILSTVTLFFKRKVSGAKQPTFVVPLWHPHIHAIVADGVFTENGHFVRIPDTWKTQGYGYLAGQGI
jgi:hypothetical protein